MNCLFIRFNSRLMLAISIVFIGWILTGAKCIEANPDLLPKEDVVCEGDDCPQEQVGVLAAAVPCGTPGQAELVVKEFYYEIRCGCQESPPEDNESPGKKCTVGVGTKVIWTFEGSEAHNVQSSDFNGSSDKAFGRYETTLGSPGQYVYYCSLHKGDMSDYKIEVVEVEQ